MLIKVADSCCWDEITRYRIPSIKALLENFTAAKASTTKSFETVYLIFCFLLFWSCAVYTLNIFIFADSKFVCDSATAKQKKRHIPKFLYKQKHCLAKTYQHQLRSPENHFVRSISSMIIGKLFGGKMSRCELHHLFVFIWTESTKRRKKNIYIHISWTLFLRGNINRHQSVQKNNRKKIEFSGEFFFSFHFIMYTYLHIFFLYI